MKKKIRMKELLATFLVIILCLCCLPDIQASVGNESVVKTENDAQKRKTNEFADVPINILSLIPKENRTGSIISESTDSSELYTIRTENPETGEGTLFVYSSPVKYKGEDGDIHFIDTTMEPINAKAKAKLGYAYRNAANSFTVEYGKTASAGVCFNEAFTVAPVSESTQERAGKANTSSSDAQVMSENGSGKLRYDGVFGPGTSVEYVNTTTGLKEAIILERYTGKHRFDFVFRSETHVPLLAENGAYIFVSAKTKLEEPDYRFLSLYAYDSAKPNENISGFRHMNEDLRYELTDNADGSYTISVVVPEEYLTHPEIVYPVTIDPSIQRVANNSNVHDTYVNQAAPTAQSYYNYDYIRFGCSNGKKMFGYIRYTELPTLPTGATVTSANLKFTFRSGQSTPSATSGIRFWTLRVTAHQWNESAITWDNQPYGTEGYYTEFTYNGRYLDYVEANVSDMVTAWYGGAPNYGMDFTYENEEYNDYNSVVSSEGDADRAPVLTVNYSYSGSTSISNNKVYYLRAKHSNFYLDVDGSASQSRNVMQHTFHGAQNQQWKIVYQGNGYYKLYSMSPLYSGKCLDVESLASNNIDVYSDGGGSWILWAIVQNGDGSYRLVNKWSEEMSKVLTVSDASTVSSANVIQSVWNGSNNQRWYIERVEKNECSRAVTEIPNNPEYDKAVQESANRFGKMPTAEYLLKATTLATATATARSGATAAALTYPVASSMLLHFLNWTGDTYTLPSNFIKNTSDISTTRETVFNQLNGAYTTLRIPNITVYYGNINTVAYGGGSAVTDWKLSVNKCELWGKVTATGTVSKQTTLYVRDFYDWKAGDMNKIFDVAADLLNQCHYAGIARDFPVIGSTDY